MTHVGQNVHIILSRGDRCRSSVVREIVRPDEDAGTNLDADRLDTTMHNVMLEGQSRYSEQPFDHSVEPFALTWHTIEECPRKDVTTRGEDK
jgi:hypothetical protein